MQAVAASFSAGIVLSANAKVNAMVSDGTLAGTTVVGKLDPSGGGKEAFRLDGSIETNLGDLAGGKVDGEAKAISDDANIVVGKAEDASEKKAVYWVGTSNTPIILSNAKSEAKAVNYDGSVIVGKVKTGPLDEAVRWDVVGNTIVETVLRDLGGDKSEARGVSDDENWVVGKGTNLSGEKVALLWDNSGAVTEIGDLVGGKGDAVANAVTFDGFNVIAVGQADTAAGKEAFRWDSGTGLMVSPSASPAARPTPRRWAFRPTGPSLSARVRAPLARKRSSGSKAMA